MGLGLVRDFARKSRRDASATWEYVKTAGVGSLFGGAGVVQKDGVGFGVAAHYG
jgi:hypothetical protein